MSGLCDACDEKSSIGLIVQRGGVRDWNAHLCNRHYAEWKSGMSVITRFGTYTLEVPQMSLDLEKRRG